MKKVSGPQVGTTAGTVEGPLPADIQEALGELVWAAREGLLALGVGLGPGVVHQLQVGEALCWRHLWNARSMRSWARRAGMTGPDGEASRTRTDR